MVHASVLQAPLDGAKAQVLNINEVSVIGGVIKVLPLPFGVAVIGESVEATQAARNALKVEWDTAGTVAANTDSNADKEDYARLGRDSSAKAITHYKVGDARAALGNAAKVLEATYWTEYLYHAQMEPMNAVAQVAENGLAAEIWTGTQFGAPAVNAISLSSRPRRTRSKSTSRCWAVALAGASGLTPRSKPRFCPTSSRSQ